MIKWFLKLFCYKFFFILIVLNFSGRTAESAGNSWENFRESIHKKINNSEIHFELIDPLLRLLILAPNENQLLKTMHSNNLIALQTCENIHNLENLSVFIIDADNKCHVKLLRIFRSLRKKVSEDEEDFKGKFNSFLNVMGLGQYNTSTLSALETALSDLLNFIAFFDECGLKTGKVSFSPGINIYKILKKSTSAQQVSPTEKRLSMYANLKKENIPVEPIVRYAGFTMYSFLHLDQEAFPEIDTSSLFKEKTIKEWDKIFPQYMFHISNHHFPFNWVFIAIRLLSLIPNFQSLVCNVFACSNLKFCIDDQRDNFIKSFFLQAALMPSLRKKETVPEEQTIAPEEQNVPEEQTAPYSVHFSDLYEAFKNQIGQLKEDLYFLPDKVVEHPESGKKMTPAEFAQAMDQATIKLLNNFGIKCESEALLASTLKALDENLRIIINYMIATSPPRKTGFELKEEKTQNCVIS